MPSSWKQIAQRRQRGRAEAIEKISHLEWFTLPDAKTSDASSNEYIRASASEIVQHIANGDPGWTATLVLQAYIEQAVVANKETNCITEVLFGEALQQAHELDEEFKATRKIKGPLHGVPVSFKDLFHVKGTAASIGFTKYADVLSTEDCELAKIVRAAGGIIFVKTNVPQTMLSFECNNPLWGRTTNPFSPLHTSGGSSGGESALLTLDGSALGFGSDLGGSLRIPTHYCGLYSLKPGKGRSSITGIRDPTPGFEAIPLETGPIARSVDDVELACRLIMGKSSEQYAGLAPVPYRDVDLPPKLRFGYFTSDLVVKASPACQRGVLETVESLRKAGHECVEFEPPNVADALKIFVGVTAAEAYRTLLSHLDSDPQDPSLFLVTLGPRLPGFLRSAAGWLIRTFTGDRLFAAALEHSRVRNVSEYWAEAAARNEYEKMWYETVWNKYGFDAIIAPPSAAPALPHGATKTLSPLVVATVLFNVLDSPVGVIPVLRVDAEKDKVTEEWIKDPGHGSKLIEDDLYNKNGTVYNSQTMEGLPVGIQLVGRKWEDEKVIAMMHVVDKALGPRGFGPGSGSSFKL